MEEYNKNLNLSPNRLSGSRFSINYNHFLETTLKLLLFVIYNYILFITFQDIYIYFLYTCFLGLAIGSAISYGIEKNKHTNRKKILIFTFIFSVLAYLMFFIIYKFPDKFYRGFRLFLLTRPLPMYILYFCLITLIIGGAILYKKSKYTIKQLLVFLIILTPLIVYLISNHIVYLYYIFNWQSVHCTKWVKFNLIPILHILYPCFLALGLRVSISYELLKNKYFSKKTILVLISLCSLLAYLVIFFAMYLSKTHVAISFLNFVHSLQCAIEQTPVFLDSSIQSITINISIWIIEFLVTFFSAWIFVIFTCSQFLPGSYSKEISKFYT